MPISNGTIAVTNGSKSITGTNTTFADSCVEADDLLIIGGLTYFVDSVTSNTALTITRAYDGTTAATKSYEINKNSLDSFSQQLSDFFLKYGTICNSVSESAGANKIPKADSNGKIAAGYLTATPFASESVEGIIQIATAAEANALTVTDKAITPAYIPIASTSQKGLVQLATAAEANALTVADKTITPATLPIATTSQKGLVQLATAEEITAGTEAAKAISPATYKTYNDSQRLIGTYVYYSTTDAPVHTLPCQGGAVSRTAYAALYAILGTSCGTGNGSTTFNLPDIRGRVLWGAASGELNSKKSAGLPNITGYVTTVPYLGSGLAYGGGLWMADGVGADIAIASGATYGRATLNLSARSSNSIYGSSSTVQPPAFCLNVGIVYE